jgi:tetratricopeptide (TPR) repeat protein
MTLIRFIGPSFFLLLLVICGCSTVGSDVAAGRNALQTGRPNDAVGYLTQAAAADPNYKIPYRVGIGVLTYLGRAYLETGNDTEARRTLEKAVQVYNDDPLAHLYLGLPC